MREDAHHLPERPDHVFARDVKAAADALNEAIGAAYDAGLLCEADIITDPGYVGRRDRRPRIHVTVARSV